METLADPACLRPAILLASSAEAAACRLASELQCRTFVLCGMITWRAVSPRQMGRERERGEMTGGVQLFRKNSTGEEETREIKHSVSADWFQVCCDSRESGP